MTGRQDEPDLFTYQQDPAPPDFDGITFNPKLDLERLNTQLARVYRAMRDGRWRTLAELRAVTGCGSECALSARMRDLRKDKFGGYIVEGRRRGDTRAGLWEYRLGTPGGDE